VSASSIGPIGMPNAVTAASITSGATPSVNHAQRLVDVGTEHAVDEKARRILDRQGNLVDLTHESRRLLAISASVILP